MRRQPSARSLLTAPLAAALAACGPGGQLDAPVAQVAAPSASPAAPAPAPAPTPPEAISGGSSWSFDSIPEGGIPSGWSIGESNGRGKLATWTTVARADAPTPPSAFGITTSSNRGSTFNLALADGIHPQDLDLTVAVRAVTGREDQGGGPVWRAADSANYYVARWNPLESNFRVYYVKDGRRKQLASAAAPGDTSAWHTIRIVAVGSHVDCHLDGELLLSVDEETFSEAGMVGLWTKADAAALFDDLRVEPVAP